MTPVVIGFTLCGGGRADEYQLPLWKVVHCVSAPIGLNQSREINHQLLFTVTVL